MGRGQRHSKNAGIMGSEALTYHERKALGFGTVKERVGKVGLRVLCSSGRTGTPSSSCRDVGRGLTAQWSATSNKVGLGGIAAARSSLPSKCAVPCCAVCPPAGLPWKLL